MTSAVRPVCACPSHSCGSIADNTILISESRTGISLEVSSRGVGVPDKSEGHRAFSCQLR